MFQALNATSTTLADFLQTSIDADPFFGTPGHPWRDRNMHVRLQTPTEMRDNKGDEGLSSGCIAWFAMRSGSTIRHDGFRRPSCVRRPCPCGCTIW